MPHCGGRAAASRVAGPPRPRSSGGRSVDDPFDPEGFDLLCQNGRRGGRFPGGERAASAAADGIGVVGDHGRGVVGRLQPPRAGDRGSGPRVLPRGRASAPGERGQRRALAARPVELGVELRQRGGGREAAAHLAAHRVAPGTSRRACASRTATGSVSHSASRWAWRRTLRDLGQGGGGVIGPMATRARSPNMTDGLGTPARPPRRRSRSRSPCWRAYRATQTRRRRAPAWP